MSFWIIIAVITTSLMAFLVWLFQRPTHFTQDSQTLRIKRNVQLYQQRSKRLDKEKQKQWIDEDEYQQTQTELARQLLMDVEQLNQSPKLTQQHKKYLLVFAFVPLLALALYQSLGAWADVKITQSLEQVAKQSQSMAQYLKNFEPIKQAILERLEQTPDNAYYRVLLAQYAKDTHNYADAALQYSVLAELYPDDDQVLSQYAQAKFLQDGQTFDTNVVAYLRKALQVNPKNVTALGLIGIYEMQNKNYPAAVKAWQKLLDVMPSDDSQERAIIAAGIKKAQHEMGLTDKQIAAQKQGISVTVSLAPSVKVSADLTVYIYAKGVDSPVPLAVQTVKAADLPQTVFLDDNDAMMPSMTLSKNAKVIVGARVSLSGKAIAGAGDWQAQSDAIDWRAKKQLSLTITEQLK